MNYWRFSYAKHGIVLFVIYYKYNIIIPIYTKVIEYYIICLQISMNIGRFVVILFLYTYI